MVRYCDTNWSFYMNHITNKLMESWKLFLNTVCNTSVNKLFFGQYIYYAKFTKSTHYRYWLSCNCNAIYNIDVQKVNIKCIISKCMYTTLSTSNPSQSSNIHPKFPLSEHLSTVVLSVYNHSYNTNTEETGFVWWPKPS